MSKKVVFLYSGKWTKFGNSCVEQGRLMQLFRQPSIGGNLIGAAKKGETGWGSFRGTETDTNLYESFNTYPKKGFSFSI